MTRHCDAQRGEGGRTQAVRPAVDESREPRLSWLANGSYRDARSEGRQSLVGQERAFAPPRRAAAPAGQTGFRASNAGRRTAFAIASPSKPCRQVLQHLSCEQFASGVPDNYVAKLCDLGQRRTERAEPVKGIAAPWRKAQQHQDGGTTYKDRAHVACE